MVGNEYHTMAQEELNKLLTKTQDQRNQDINADYDMRQDQIERQMSSGGDILNQGSYGDAAGGDGYYLAKSNAAINSDPNIVNLSADEAFARAELAPPDPELVQAYNSGDPQTRMLLLRMAANYFMSTDRENINRTENAKAGPDALAEGQPNFSHSPLAR